MKQFKIFAKYVANCSGLNEELIEVYAADLDRIYIKYNDTEEYIIRLWNWDAENIYEYTLFKIVPDNTGSHGIAIYTGENYYLD